MQKRLLVNILTFEKPADFCHLSKVILEVFFKTVVSYLIGFTKFADFYFI